MMGESHLSQMNHGGGVGRSEPPKRRKITLNSGAMIWEISKVGLRAPTTSARAVVSENRRCALTDTVREVETVDAEVDEECPGAQAKADPSVSDSAGESLT